MTPVAKDEHKVTLVIGNYDKGNVGEEIYRVVFDSLFGECIYVGFDELGPYYRNLLRDNPGKVTRVVCGGGDVVTEDFMQRISMVVRPYYGPVYAIGVGIADQAIAVKYLNVFDHVFARSSEDVAAAARAIGDKNVTHMPDLAWALAKLPVVGPRRQPRLKKNIAIALAQPVLFENPNAEALLDSFETMVRTLVNSGGIGKIFLLAFNTQIENTAECDYFANAHMMRRLADLGSIVVNCNDPSLQRPADMIVFMRKNVDFVFGMRYHSIVFSLIYDLPFIAIHASSKITKLIEDHDASMWEYSIPRNNNECISNIDPDALARMYHARLMSTWQRQPIDIDLNLIQSTCNATQRKLAARFPNPPPSIEQVLERCTTLLARFMDVTPAFFHENIIDAVGFFAVANVNIDDAARVLSYAITGNPSSAYMWSIVDAMKMPDFVLRSCITTVLDDTGRIFAETKNCDNLYLPAITGRFNRRCTIDMDHFPQFDFDGYHRAGWSYAMGGVRAAMAEKTHGRNHVFVLDSYVDRTFHWGKHALLADNVIPYNVPWIGFVHHTFDTTYSNYNCVNLVQTPEFVQSLPKCAALITLSFDLQKKLLVALKDIGFGHTKVVCMRHPTIFTEKTFTWERFLANQNRRVVHVGAWMRNPFALFQLPLDPYYKNPLEISKAIVKGKDMDACFRPPGLLEVLEDILDDRITQCARSHGPCRALLGNKYVAGLEQHIQQLDQSVTVIDKLNDEEFDALLAENIIFLNLVDASAVNTVIECIVRNTILLVNRLPALEEVLGEEYPGFYDNILHAADMLRDPILLKQIHVFMKERVDKAPFALERFVVELQNIILSLA